VEQQIEGRWRFQQHYPCRQNCQGRPFLVDLAKPKPFTEWLQREVVLELEDERIMNPSEDITCLSRGPLPRATKYQSIWAFGNHYRVARVEAHLKTYDSGVAAAPSSLENRIGTQL
jgi:hypothetical protein